MECAGAVARQEGARRNAPSVRVRSGSPAPASRAATAHASVSSRSIATAGPATRTRRRSTAQSRPPSRRCRPPRRAPSHSVSRDPSPPRWPAARKRLAPRRPGYGTSTGAQAWAPPATCAHAVPAQQAPGLAKHASPGLTHSGSAGATPTATQTVAPAAPTHDPPQHSSDVEQAAPVGAQAVAAGVSAGRVGQAEAPATLRRDHTRIAGRGAPRPARQAAHQPRGVGATAGAGAALVGLHAQLADDAAVIGDPARRLRAAADALGADVAYARAARRVRRAALLLGLTAAGARASVRAVRRRARSGRQQQSLSSMHSASAGRHPGSA